MKKNRALSLLIILCVLVSFLPVFPVAAAAAGTTIYVATTGNDSTGDGTEANPYLSIQKAVNMVVPGTTVLVDDGIYNEQVVASVSGRPDAPIRIKSKNKWGAHIQYDSPGVNAYIVEIRGSFVSIEDFEISGDCPTGILLRNNNTLASGNNIHGMGETPIPGTTGGAGILTADDLSATDKYYNMNVIGNVIHDIYGKFMMYQGIYIEHGGGGLIQNNIVYNINNGCAIVTWHSGSGIEANPLYISNNLTWNTTQNGILVGHGDSYPGTVTDYVYVTNNIIVGPNGLGGLSAYGPLGENIHFINNILWKDTISFDSFDANEQIVLKETPIPVTGIDQFEIQPTPSDLAIDLTNTRFITEDPFVNFKADGTGDYHLKPGSPYINAGIDLGAPVIDIDGFARPKNKPDPGVYESPELLSNPGFELFDANDQPVCWSLSQWLEGDMTYGRDLTEKHSGDSSLKITSTGLTTNPSYPTYAQETVVSMSVAVSPDTSYSLEAYLKAIGINQLDGAFTHIVERDADGKDISRYHQSDIITRKDDLNDWTKIAQTFTVANNCTNIDIYLVYEGDGECWIDDASLVPVTDDKQETPMPLGDPTNILTNPGFEEVTGVDENNNPILSGWTLSDWGGSPGFASDGTVQKSGKLSMKLYSVDGSHSSPVISRNLLVSGNKDYNASVWVKINSSACDTTDPAHSGGLRTFIYIVQNDSNGTRLNSDLMSPPVSDAADWTQIDFDFKTDAAAASLDLYIVFQGDGAAWFDDARFGPVTAPVAIPLPDVTPYNLVLNPGFEAGTSSPTGWLYYGGNTSGSADNPYTMGTFSMDNTVFYEGQRSVKIVNTRYTDYSTLIPASSSDWSPVLPNTLYEATGQFKSEGLGADASCHRCSSSGCPGCCRFWNKGCSRIYNKCSC